MDNSKIINQINQLFHNKGVKQEERFNLLIELLENNKKSITWRCMKNRHGEQKDFTTAFSGAHQQFEILS